MFTLSNTLKRTYPDVHIGILAIQNTSNPKENTALNEAKKALEADLRQQFSDADRAAIKALPTIKAYNNFYKKFKKTYHVQLQLESVVLKGKPIPQVAALVETMFMAELKNKLLTAGHDLEVLQQPVEARVAQGDESFIGMSGKTQTLKAGDMYITDSVGVLSSVIYGPDQRTRITAKTRQTLFTVYAPAGIEKEAVMAHLQDIQNYVSIITPQAEVIQMEVYG